MIKILHIIGTRPQYIKSSILIRKLSKNKKFKNIIIDTFQHFDENMSDIFLKEFKMTTSVTKLKINKNDTRITRLSKMIRLLGEYQNKINPHIGIIYGDTDTTLSGAISLKKNGIKIMHVEAGLRSYDKDMPEEQNRIVADQLSDYLIAPTKIAEKNLLKENFKKKKIFMFGDTMYDLALETSKKLKKQKNKEYVLMTLHRDINTAKERLTKIIKGLSNLNHKIIWPIHPKLKKILNIQKIKIPKNTRIIEPISYKKNLSLIKNANFIITDSGGIQKESYFLGKYSFILRKETEWQEIVNDKKSFIIDCETKKIKKYKIDNKKFIPKKLFGNGNASEKIIKLLKKIN